MNKLNLENICMWHMVARNDLKKIIDGNTCITFSMDKPCYTCTGYKFDCETYQPLYKPEDDYKGDA